MYYCYRILLVEVVESHSEVRPMRSQVKSCFTTTTTLNAICGHTPSPYRLFDDFCN